MPLRLSDSLRIECHTWDHAKQWAIPIRTAVFVHEQGVAAHLELDSADPDCTHALAFGRDGEAIGTARLLPDGRIGRMAVLKAWRGHGVGSALMQALLDCAARSGLPRVTLHAQQQSCGFYARFGFQTQGTVYLEAGIPHLTMILELPDIPMGDAG